MHINPYISFQGIKSKCEKYIALEEEALSMASKIRALQGWVTMLDYAEREEVRQVVGDLIKDSKSGNGKTFKAVE